MFAVSGDPPACNTHTSLIFKKNFRYYPQIFPRSSVSTVAYTTKMRRNIIIYNITLFGESNRFFFWTTKMRYIIIYTLFGESSRFFWTYFSKLSRGPHESSFSPPPVASTGLDNHWRRQWVRAEDLGVLHILQRPQICIFYILHNVHVSHSQSGSCNVLSFLDFLEPFST